MGDPPMSPAVRLHAISRSGVAGTGPRPERKARPWRPSIDEIAPDIFRLSTLVDEIAPPAGFTFNQFLVRGEEPFLFHTGMRQLFPLVSERRRRDHPARRPALDLLRPRRGRRVRRHEPVPRRAPHAQVVHGELACMLSLNDLATGRPAPIGDDERSTSAATGCGSSRRRTSPTTGRAGCGSTRRPATLFAGDLFTQVGDGPAVTDDDLVEAGARGRGDVPRDRRCGPDLVPTLHRLADLGPRRSR